MSEIKFTCPKCKESLEGDDSMRGQVVQCPTCNTNITAPVALKKQIILSKAGASGGSSAYIPPPKPKTSKVGIMVALIVGLVIGYGAGSAKVSSGITGSVGGSGFSFPSFGRMSKGQWWQKFKQNKLDEKIGYQAQFGTGGYCTKDEFIGIMGKPDKAQKVGGQAYWYYTCKDGQIQMVLNSGNLESVNGGNVILDNSNGINEY